MYFSSDVGKGFIISDDEEVTGVISVVNMSRKKSKRIRCVDTSIIAYLTKHILNQGQDYRHHIRHSAEEQQTEEKQSYQQHSHLSVCQQTLFLIRWVTGRSLLCRGPDAKHQQVILTNQKLFRHSMVFYSRGATQSPDISRYQGSHYQENGKRYRSEMMLNIPNRSGW